MSLIELIVIIVGKQRADKRKQEQYDDQHKRDHRKLVFAEAAHGVFPKRRSLTNDDKILLLFVRSRNKEIRVDMHAQRIETQADFGFLFFYLLHGPLAYRSLILGSTMP